MCRGEGELETLERDFSNLEREIVYERERERERGVSGNIGRRLVLPVACGQLSLKQISRGLKSDKKGPRKRCAIAAELRWGEPSTSTRPRLANSFEAKYYLHR